MRRLRLAILVLGLSTAVSTAFLAAQERPPSGKDTKEKPKKGKKGGKKKEGPQKNPE